MNYKLFHDINQFAGNHPFLDGLMIFITEKALFIYALVLLAMWFFGKTKHKESVCFAAITGAFALFVNFVIGLIYFEPRPFETHTVQLLLDHAADASFPSDHTTGAFSLALAVLFRHRKIGIGMLVFAFLTGFSRVYVGHHYPFDVLGSIVVSVVVSLLVFKMSSRLQPISDGIIRIYNSILKNATAK